MAQIPDQLPIAQVDGAAPSTAVVAPSDFGLERAGATIENVAAGNRRVQALQIRAQAQQDSEAARPALLALQGANQDDLETSAAADAGKPGFVDGVLQRTQDRAQRAIPANASPGVVSEFNRMAAAETARVTSAAGMAHARALAQPIAEAAAAAQASKVGDGLTGFAGAFEPAYQALKLDHAAGDTDLPAKTAAAFDTASAAAIAAADPSVQPNLQAQFAALKPKYVSDALDFQLQHAQTTVLQGASAQIGAVANTILSSPGAYDNAVNVLGPAITQALPRGLQDAATKDYRAQFAKARVQALIQTDHPDAAQAELNAGAYDAVFTPEEKSSLLAQADAGVRAAQAQSLPLAMAHADIRHREQDNEASILATGKPTANAPTAAEIGGLNVDEQADILTRRTEASRKFAAVGPVADMTNEQLAMAAATKPDPNSPEFQAQDLHQRAAQRETTARQQQPGAWAWTTSGGAPQKLYGEMLQAQGAGVAPAGIRYAGAQLLAQSSNGMPPENWQIVPQATAAAMAAEVMKAPPDQRLAKLKSVASLYAALPPALTMSDGSRGEPQRIFIRQLLAAKMTPAEVSAVVDGAAHPGNMAAVLGSLAAAEAGVGVKGELAQGQYNQAKREVIPALRPYLNVVAALPGQQDLAQGRIDRLSLEAANLMATQKMSASDAAKTVTAEFNDRYTFFGDTMMPKAVAEPRQWHYGGLNGPTGYVSGRDLATAGMIHYGTAVIAADGANLYAPAGETAKDYALKVQHSASWRPLPDDSGMTLMVPHQDGGWDQVADKWGQPIRATWSQLNDMADTVPTIRPGAGVARTAGGRPIPAANDQTVFNAMAAEVEQQESHGRNGLTSPKGALGVMQIMPDTGAAFAPRLNLVWDPQRALNDAPYNRQIGRGVLLSNVSRYGPSQGGQVLALAAYNAGPANVDKWLRTIGDPRSGYLTPDQWVQRIPFQETRAYVAAIVPRIRARIAGGE